MVLADLTGPGLAWSMLLLTQVESARVGSSLLCSGHDLTGCGLALALTNTGQNLVGP